ncbi:MAG: hypothetical protein L7V86_19455 [Verrucomicrobiales bacterium]|jgi:hypothetical protein|nr:hypothetical protein [Verrucomicrobiales bacterium]
MGPVARGIKDGSKSHWLASKFAKAGESSIISAIQEELGAGDKTLSQLAGHRPERFQDDLST